MSSPAHSIISEHEGELLEDVDMEGGNQSQAEEVNENDENKENEEEQEKKIVKPKRVVRNPRPKLDVELLRGPKGLCTIEKYFKNHKYNGPGHEASDLRTIMKTYEYWCHRLFPKYSFDDCIAKLETLGNKKQMQTYIKRIRLGMDDFVDAIDKPVISDDEMDQPAEEATSHNDVFDDLVYQNVQSTQKPVELTAEQLERIRINKERAQRIRLEKLRKLQEKANTLINESSTLPSTSADEQMETNEQGESSSVDTGSQNSEHQQTEEPANELNPDIDN